MCDPYAQSLLRSILHNEGSQSVGNTDAERQPKDTEGGGKVQFLDDIRVRSELPLQFSGLGVDFGAHVPQGVHTAFLNTNAWTDAAL